MKVKEVIESLIKKDQKIKEIQLVSKSSIVCEENYCCVIYEDGNHSLYSYPDYKLLNGVKGNVKKIKEQAETKKLITEEDNDYKYKTKEFETIYEKYKNDLIEKYKEINSFSNLSNLYREYDRKDESTKRTWDNYDNIFDIVKKVCEEENIEYEQDKQKIIDRNIDKIEEIENKKQEKYPPSFREKISLEHCKTIEKIREYVEKRKKELNEIENINNRKLKYGFEETSLKLYKADIISYPATMLQKDYLVGTALQNKDFQNRKEIIKHAMEFLIAFPQYCALIGELEKQTNQMFIDKQNITIEKSKENKEFDEALDDIINHDSQETYYYHGTTKENAEQILKQGLYIYKKDLLFTSVSELSKNGVLTYEYQDDVSIGEKVGDYLVIISQPEGEEIIRKINKEEKKEIPEIQSRTIELSSTPNYIIDKSHIVGYIDKVDYKVIKNPNYIPPQQEEQKGITKGSR